MVKHMLLVLVFCLFCVCVSGVLGVTWIGVRSVDIHCARSTSVSKGFWISM